MALPFFAKYLSRTDPAPEALKAALGAQVEKVNTQKGWRKWKP